MKINLVRNCMCGAWPDPEIYIGDREPQNPKIEDDGCFVQGVKGTGGQLEETSIEEIKTIYRDIEDRGPDDGPSEDELMSIYEIVKRDLKTTPYESQYTDMISNLTNHKLDHVTIDQGNGYRQSSVIYQLSGSEPPNGLVTGIKIYMVSIANGDGCCTTRIVLGIFSDEHEFKSFERKAADALKHFKSVEDGVWALLDSQTFILKPDLKTFANGGYDRIS